MLTPSQAEYGPGAARPLRGEFMMCVCRLLAQLCSANLLMGAVSQSTLTRSVGAYKVSGLAFHKCPVVALIPCLGFFLFFPPISPW